MSNECTELAISIKQFSLKVQKRYDFYLHWVNSHSSQSIQVHTKIFRLEPNEKDKIKNIECRSIK